MLVHTREKLDQTHGKCGGAQSTPRALYFPHLPWHVQANTNPSRPGLLQLTGGYLASMGGRAAIECPTCWMPGCVSDPLGASESQLILGSAEPWSDWPFSSWGFEGDVLGLEIRRLFSSRRQRAGFLTCKKQPSVPLYLPTVFLQSVLISYGC